MNPKHDQIFFAIGQMVFPAKPGSQKRPHEESELHEEATKNGEGNGTSEPPPKRKRPFNFDAHPRRKIALQFLYHGWEYEGLVQQSTTENTVERHLMDALLKTKLISNEKDCDFSRCGRTDRGVSAFKQVAALVVRSADPSGKFVFWPESTDQSVIDNYPKKDELSYLKMLNGVLPKNISLMRRAGALLVGTHDFRNFCQVDMNEKRVNMSFVREIFEVSLDVVPTNSPTSSSSRNDLVELTIKGSGFLWHMIRYIVTVLHEIGQGNEEPENHPVPARYIKFADRRTCDSLEQKKEKLEKKKMAANNPDDIDYKNFFCDADAMFFKKKSKEWWTAFKDETDEQKWTEELGKIGANTSQSRKVVANAVLDVIIAKKYNETASVHNLTSVVYLEKEEARLAKAQNTQNPLNLIDYSSPEFAAKVKELCHLLGITDHPDPVVSLKAACIFISENLNETVVNERNAERKSGKEPNTFDLRSFPIDLPDQKDGAVNAAGRILRLLNIEVLRKTQTSVNETLVAIQNLTIDQTKKPATKQVKYGF
ncbi:tRNA pseudouridine synthase A [Ancylostoma ceylanicum]|uniref:tRNA pseudouridine synthase A n=1 Tax=Ancylostoma ceylanicum TaxID=53326 RepID=A0A0D6LXR0_9BILA|nr:tRNA pseudouridine synthase A [Ancylostoma ceylanicum]